jgi:hypothetical protein
MINRLYLSFVHYYLCVCRYIQGDCGGKVDIFENNNIGHCEKKNVYTNMCQILNGTAV